MEKDNSIPLEDSPDESTMVIRQITYSTEAGEEIPLGTVLAPPEMDIEKEHIQFLEAIGVTKQPQEGVPVFKGSFLDWLYDHGAQKG